MQLLRMYQEKLTILKVLLDKQCISEAKDAPTNSLIENLKTIPVVSSKTIATVISECHNLSRFSKPTKFIECLGLFPTQNSSNNFKSTGKLSNVIHH